MTERPFVLWKCAASLDGRIAAADGSSNWITSAEARADGHRLRAECGAVMVGSGTQQADDPQLAVRDAEATRQPLRIIVDSNARTPASARVLDDAAPTLIAVGDDAVVSHLDGRAEVVRLPRVDAGLTWSCCSRRSASGVCGRSCSKVVRPWLVPSWPPV
jgi:diaminohydroxyphosphoribosylaminopyrimidine deaminase/5-amino-6-(5-phosphoribosylamino)uracil reductase